MVDYLKIKKAYNDELYHHGVEGQRKGHRRYQYPDGSLTPLGREHYNVGAPRHPKDSDIDYNKDYEWTDKDGNKHVYKTRIDQLDNKELAEAIARDKMLSNLESKKQQGPDVSDALRDTSKLLDATARAFPTGGGKYVKKDYSYMTDQQLRDKISRLQLEESYGRLTGETKYVKSGSEKTREILQTAGTIVAIGASAAGLALTIKNMMDARHGEIKSNDPNALSHYGIQGQKKGVRRFQYPNGTLTPEGKERYRQDTGTKEIMKNTSNYSDLIRRKQIKEYEKYGERVGAKKGFFAGMGIGALAGLTKQGLKVGKRYKDSGSILDDGDDGTELINKFIGKALLGAMAGAGIGTLAGAKMGKKNAQAKLAEHGKQYVDDLLDIPVDRLHIRKY